MKRDRLSLGNEENESLVDARLRKKRRRDSDVDASLERTLLRSTADEAKLRSKLINWQSKNTIIASEYSVNEPLPNPIGEFWDLHFFFSFPVFFSSLSFSSECIS